MRTLSQHMGGGLLQVLVVALAGLVEKFEQQFVVVATRIMEEEKAKDRSSPVIVAEAAGGWSVVSQPGLGITYHAAADNCRTCVTLAHSASSLSSANSPVVCVVGAVVVVVALSCRTPPS